MISAVILRNRATTIAFYVSAGRELSEFREVAPLFQLTDVRHPDFWLPN